MDFKMESYEEKMEEDNENYIIIDEDPLAEIYENLKK